MELSVARRGWKPSLPDGRDYHPETEEVRRLTAGLPPRRPTADVPPPAVDLREYFPPVEDQQDLASGTAHACLALFTYFERRAMGRNPRLSRLFLHQTSCRLSGDPFGRNLDVEIRTALKAMARCGVPPEHLWPYRADRLNSEPDALLYSFSREFQDLIYFRLDQRDAIGRKTLNRLRSYLRAGIPCVFGIPLSDWISCDPEIPYLPRSGGFHGGQALVAVGYDDDLRCTSRGALLVRNSWGTNWGERGYGWLPYDYIIDGIATEFWLLLREDWLQSGEFFQPETKGELP